MNTFFLIIYLYLVLPAVVGQRFNPTAELEIPIGRSTKEAKQRLKHNHWQQIITTCLM